MWDRSLPRPFLKRQLVERLAARAIRDEKNLAQLVLEVVEAGARRRDPQRWHAGLT
jgi:hypothetical protein